MKVKPCPEFKALLQDSFDRFTALGDQFYDYFYQEFVNADPHIATYMENIPYPKRKAILEESLKYTVLISGGDSHTTDFQTLRIQHGSDGLGITLDMLMGWRRALLDSFMKFDPEVSPYLQTHWAHATLNLIQHFHIED